MLKGIVLYIIGMLLSGLSIAQSFSQFQNISALGGLPSDYVFSMDEDAHGFFWIGTDKGLARFDGFRWQVFTTEQGLPGNYIQQVEYADEKGLWIFVGTKGLYYYDVQQKQASAVAAPVDGQTLQKNKEGIYFQSYNMINGVQWRTLLMASRQTPTRADTIFVHQMAAGQPSIYIDIDKKQIVSFSSSESKSTLPHIKIYKKPWQVKHSQASMPSTSLLQKVSEGIFKNTTSVFIQQSLGQIKEVRLFHQSNAYLHALRYKNGTMVWDEKTGLYHVKDNGETIKYSAQQGLLSTLITDVQVAKNNQLLISSLGQGIYYMLPEGNAVLSTGREQVKGIALREGVAYAATNDRVLSVNMTTKESRSYPISEADVQSIDVWGNRLFVSSLKGIGQYQFLGHKLQKTTTQIHHAGISAVVKWGDKYYAGAYGDRVQTFTPGNTTLYPLSNMPFVSEKLCVLKSGLASFNYEDGLTILGNDGRIQHYNMYNGLPSNAVYDVHEYDDSIFVSTAKGVSVFFKGKKTVSYTVREGLANEKCMYSFHDTSGNYYVAGELHLQVRGRKGFSMLAKASIVNDKDDRITNCVYDSGTNTLLISTMRHLQLLPLSPSGTVGSSLSPAIISINSGAAALPVHQPFQLPSDYGEIKFHFHPVDANPFLRPSVYYCLKGYESSFVLLRDSLTVTYSRLRKGSYSLVAKVLSADGEWSNEVQLASFTVQPAFTESGWFVALVSLAVSGITLLILMAWQKAKRKTVLRQKAVADMLDGERNRISKELHDHLGTALVTMVAQADNIEQKLMQQQLSEALEKTQQLSEQSRETINVLRETIWAVQESSHNIDEFVMRTRNFLQRTLSAKNIAWQVEITGEPNASLSSQQTLQLFRIIQECIQNIIKYAEASYVLIKNDVQTDQVVVSIQDDGKGFDTTKPSPGNGLQNIKARMDTLNGHITINSCHKGTVVSVHCPLLIKTL